MKKRVLLVNPPSADRSVNRDMAGGLGYCAGEGVVLPPLDLLIMASSLRDMGYKVQFRDGLVEKVKNFNFDLIIGSLALPTIDEDVSFYRAIKDKHPRVKVIIKTGINYGRILDDVLALTKADKIIFGESDLNILECIARKKRIVDGGKVSIMDSIPIPARELGKVGRYKYGLLPGIVTTMQTSRGCPFPCAYYCPYPLVQGKQWRAMSPLRVIRELEIIESLGIKNVLFRDATFTLDMVRAKKICELMIKRRIRINWWCETRLNVLDNKLLRLMKRAGCKGINVGVESLDEKLIETEGKPGVSIVRVREMRVAAKRIGVKLHFLMIIGLPDENVKTLYETFKRLGQIKPDSVGFTVITPYPGTKLFEEAKRENLISGFDWNHFNGQNINMRTKYLSRKEIWLAKFLLTGTSYCLRRDINWGVSIIDWIFKLWIGIKGC